MPSPVAVPHPLVDGVAGGVLLSRSDGEVVALTPLRADLLREATAAGRRVVLITGPGARITEPLRAAMAETACGWAVDAGDGRWYAGRGGRALGAPEEAAEPGVGEPVAAFARPNARATLQLSFAVSSRQRAERAARIGDALEVVAGVADAAPIGWGPHEPVERPWDVDAVTAFVRSVSPDPVRLQVAGAPGAAVSGSILVQRTQRGLEEVLEVLVAGGPPGSAQADTAVARVPGALATLAGHGLPLFALVLARPGEPDLTLRPVLQWPSRPVAALLGAPAVRELGLDVPALATEFGGTAIGHPRVPGLVVPFGDDGWPRLLALVDRIGPERIAAATGARLHDLGDEARRAP